MCVVGARGREVVAEEKSHIVLGVGVVGNPRATKPGRFAMSHLFAESGGRVDIEADVDADESQLLLNVFAEVEIAGRCCQRNCRQPFAVGTASFGQQFAGAVGVVVVAVRGRRVETRQSAGNHSFGARYAYVVA